MLYHIIYKLSLKTIYFDIILNLKWENSCQPKCCATMEKFQWMWTGSTMLLAQNFTHYLFLLSLSKWTVWNVEISFFVALHNLMNMLITKPKYQPSKYTRFKLMEDSPFPNGCIQIYEQHTFIHDKVLNEEGSPMCLAFMNCTSHKASVWQIIIKCLLTQTNV